MSEALSETSDTILPSGVLNQWEAALQHTTLTESQHTLVWAAIRYVLPPVNREQLQRAINVYTHDHAIDTPADAMAQLQHLNIPTAALTQYTVRYPLCHALTDPKAPKALPNVGIPFQRDARQMLSQYFSDVAPEAEAGLWYQDLQQTRDVLCELSKMGNDESILPPIDRNIISLINQHLMASSATSKALQKKCARVMKLFAAINKTSDDNARKPGVRKREKSSRNGGRSHHNLQPSVTTQLTEQLHEALQVQRQHRIKASHQLNADAVDKTALTEPFSSYRKPFSQAAITRDLGLSSATYNVVERFTHHETNDNQPLTVERKVPSTLTKHDDNTLLKKAGRQAATDTLVSISDIQRLTAEQIVTLLTGCQTTPILWAFCLLLLSTGLPYKRLISLERSDEMPASYPASEESLYWNPNTGYIWYALLDGPSCLEDGLNTQVVLELPKALNQVLMVNATEPESDKPLISAPKALQEHTRRQKKTLTGLLPTPARLTASAPLLIRSLAQDETAQFALSGRFGAQNGAKAAYRALLPGELNRLFNDVLTILNGHLSCSNAHETDAEKGTLADSGTPRFETAREEACEPTAIIPDAPPLPTTEPEEITHHQPSGWQTGSLLAAHPRQFNAWFEGLDNAISETLTRFTLVLSPRKRPVKEACTLSRLLACRAYLLLLLSTGCRPHGPNTRYCLSDKQLWIADKDSPQYRESRVVPAVPVLVKTLEQHELLLNSMTRWIKKRGGNVIDLRTDNQAIGYLQTRSKKEQQYVITSIEHRDFQQTLEKHLPNNSDDSASIRVRNVTRHSVATHLRTILPAPIVDGLLGHTGSGVRPTTPESIARPHERTSFTAAIENLLQQSQATTFNTKGVLHVFTE